MTSERKKGMACSEIGYRTKINSSKRLVDVSQRRPAPGIIVGSMVRRDARTKEKTIGDSLQEDCDQTKWNMDGETGGEAVTYPRRTSSRCSGIR